MTGLEHYKQAERLIADDDIHEPPTAGNIALAQVHATLALAAAQTHAVEFGELLGDISMHSMLLALDPQEADALKQRIRQTLGIADGAK